MKPTLLVLAAGMASRYGSLKQMEGVGPSDEAIIDYSIYDAIRAGFGKVVFVIRESFAKDFRDVFNPKRFNNQIAIEFVFQELNKLPDGYNIPAGREKPWGTNHAIMMASDCIKEPFAVINADDFYGRDAFRVMAEYLKDIDGCSGKYAMVAYNLENTLSDNGSVSRGVCTANNDGNLLSMVERTSIIKQADGSIAYMDGEQKNIIDGDTLVSMNFFGFTPDYFGHSQNGFKEFLDNESVKDIKAEYFIPKEVNNLISKGIATMRVLESDAKWFGVTYKDDKPMVVSAIKQLVDSSVYPANLWSN